MKPRTSTWSLLTVVLILLLPALIGCSSGGQMVQATPQTPADLPTPDLQIQAQR